MTARKPSRKAAPAATPGRAPRQLSLDPLTVRRVLTRARTDQIEAWAHNVRPKDPAYKNAQLAIAKLEEMRSLRGWIIRPGEKRAHRELVKLTFASQIEGELLALVQEAMRVEQTARGGKSSGKTRAGRVAARVRTIADALHKAGLVAQVTGAHWIPDALPTLHAARIYNITGTKLVNEAFLRRHAAEIRKALATKQRTK